MKTIKKIAVFAILASFSLTMSAQGFAKFEIEGGMADGSIRFAKEGASKVEVIAGSNVDLKNVKCKYKLLGGCSLATALDKDFTKPQTVTVNKNNGTSNEWEITVKKITPAPLPINLEFSKTNPAVWTPEVKGWINAGTDESKPTVVRFGNYNVGFIVAFEGEAKEVSFDLILVGKAGDAFNGAFEVMTSVDGISWTNIEGFDSKLTADSQFKCPVSSDARFIKWNYKERGEKQNVNLNNIIVSAK